MDNDWDYQVFLSAADDDFLTSWIAATQSASYLVTFILRDHLIVDRLQMFSSGVLK